jgi:hypothetical protein
LQLPCFLLKLLRKVHQLDNVEAGSQNQNASELSAALATVNVNFHIPPQNIRAASCMEFKHDKVNELIYSPEAKTQ